MTDYEKLKLRNDLKQDGESTIEVSGITYYFLFDECAFRVEIYKDGEYVDYASSFLGLIEWLEEEFNDEP